MSECLTPPRKSTRFSWRRASLCFTRASKIRRPPSTARRMAGAGDASSTRKEECQLRGDFLTARYTRNPDFIFRKVADEMILVPVRSTGSTTAGIFTLNDVGAAIWNLLDEKNTVKDIRDRIVEQFEVGPEQAETDVRDFIARPGDRPGRSARQRPLTFIEY